MHVRDLTTELLAPYTNGGQLLVQDPNPSDPRIRRGTPKTITVDNGMLRVTFRWYTYGFPLPKPEYWTHVPVLQAEYSWPLNEHSTVTEGEYGPDTISIHNTDTGILLTFYPANAADNVDEAGLKRHGGIF